MKILIIGNGVAGTFSAQNIRNLDKEVKIEIITRENYPYYTRIKLPELISDKFSLSDLIIFDEKWYEKNNIHLRLNTVVKKIHTKHKHVLIAHESDAISYDKLILATGSVPNLPPIKNVKEFLGKGVFTLRTIEDALKIKKFIEDKNVEKVIIIGGGLLGLELARQIKNRDLDTTVVEFFPRLLPKQLDMDCGSFLKNEIENMGINVILDAETQEILGNEQAIGIKIKNGPKIDGDLVLIQAGVTPKTELAKGANIDINKGILVNQYLETNALDVFAVGDCIEYKNQTWGIIPACIEQSKVVAPSVLGIKEKQYSGTVPQNTLKIVGIDLTSIGVFDPSDKDLIGAGWEILKNIDEKSKCYKKIVLKDNKLKGAILFGEKKAVPFINKHMESEINEEDLRKALNLYKWKCNKCGYIYDEAKKDKPLEQLPDDWICNCGASKKDFIKISLY